MTIIFWVSLSVLAYVYLGYPLLVAVLAKLFGREPLKQPGIPTVSLLIPAYNEEAYIASKLRNSLALDYPKSRLEIVVASDGSTDATDATVERYASRGVKLMSMSGNIGKAAMLSRIIPELTGEIVVFSDASSELAPDALRCLVRNFADRRVGCASGTYRLKGARHDLRGRGEGA